MNTMKQSQIPRKLYTVIIIGVIAVSTVVFMQSKLPAQEDGQVDSSKWEIHRNEEYGFELKHPVNLEIHQGPLPNVFLLGEGPIEEMISIVIENDSWIQRKYPENWMCVNVLIDNSEALRCEGENLIEEKRGVEGPFIYKIVAVTVEHGERVYNLRFSNNIELVEKFLIFDEVLSSFRFTN